MYTCNYLINNLKCKEYNHYIYVSSIASVMNWSEKQEVSMRVSFATLHVIKVEHVIVGKLNLCVHFQPAQPQIMHTFE